MKIAWVWRLLFILEVVFAFIMVQVLYKGPDTDAKPLVVMFLLVVLTALTGILSTIRKKEETQ